MARRRAETASIRVRHYDRALRLGSGAYDLRHGSRRRTSTEDALVLLQSRRGSDRVGRVGRPRQSRLGRHVAAAVPWCLWLRRSRCGSGGG
jgi:hypothetical protein